MRGQVTKTRFSPLIVGILTASMLEEKRYPESAWTCDGLELRADGLEETAVVPALHAFDDLRAHRGFAGPVIFTLRLRRDGGAWPEERAAERETIWRTLARGTRPLCDYLDVEIETAATVSTDLWNALTNRPRVLLSHHACEGEDPAAWEVWLQRMRAYHPAGVKFAVAVHRPSEAEALLRFAEQIANEFPFSCVLGMGPVGRSTRVLSPLRGCPITYAYLGDAEVAPGQLPPAALRAFFSDTHGAPPAAARESEQLAWAEGRLKELGYG